jgi:hypothetical protein
MNIEADNLRHDDVQPAQRVFRQGRPDQRDDDHPRRAGRSAPGRRRQPARRGHRRPGPAGVLPPEARPGGDPTNTSKARPRLIEYDGKADQVRFSKRAVMRRYVGTRVNDEATGDQISFDNTTEVLPRGRRARQCRRRLGQRAGAGGAHAAQRGGGSRVRRRAARRPLAQTRHRLANLAAQAVTLGGDRSSRALPPDGAGSRLWKRDTCRSPMATARWSRTSR